MKFEEIFLGVGADVLAFAQSVLTANPSDATKKMRAELGSAIKSLKATGTASNSDFVRKVQFELANKNVDAAIALCDKQKGSVGNVMKAGLKKYKEMISANEFSTDQKVAAIQKEVEEAKKKASAAKARTDTLEV